MKKLLLTFVTCCVTAFGYSQNLKVLLLHADNSFAGDVKNKLENTPIVNEVDLFDVGTATPSVNYLQEYNAVLVYRNSHFQNVITLGDVLADFIELGGGVVNAVFDNQNNGPNSNSVIAGNFVNYKLLDTEFDAYGVPASLGNINNPSHPIMENVTTFSLTNYHLYNSTLYPGSVVIAEYTDGSPLVVVKENVGPASAKRVFLNFFPPSSDVESDSWNSSTDGDLLMANALNWVSSPIAVSYCTSKSTRNRFEWINRVELGGDIDQASGRNTPGYADYTSEVLEVETEDNITVTVTPGYKRRAYREYWRIWADWNYDGDFDDAGEKVFEQNGKNMQSGSFTVPVSTSEDDLRIRVSMRWKKYAPSCGNFSNGEVEDYTLRVLNDEILIIPDPELLDLEEELLLDPLSDLLIDPIPVSPRLGEDYTYDEESYTEIGELYANPIQTGAFITGVVRVSKPGNKMFFLRNTLGQLVKSVSVNCLDEESEFELPTSGLQSGIYFLTVDTDQEATKVVIR